MVKKKDLDSQKYSTNVKFIQDIQYAVEHKRHIRTLLKKYDAKFKELFENLDIPFTYEPYIKTYFIQNVYCDLNIKYKDCKININLTTNPPCISLNINSSSNIDKINELTDNIKIYEYLKSENFKQFIHNLSESVSQLNVERIGELNKYFNVIECFNDIYNFRGEVTLPIGIYAEEKMYKFTEECVKNVNYNARTNKNAWYNDIMYEITERGWY